MVSVKNVTLEEYQLQNLRFPQCCCFAG